MVKIGIWVGEPLRDSIRLVTELLVDGIAAICQQEADKLAEEASGAEGEEKAILRARAGTAYALAAKVRSLDTDRPPGPSPYECKACGLIFERTRGHTIAHSCPRCRSPRIYPLYPSPWDPALTRKEGEP